jgi:GntR family transcriptional regulator
MAEPMYRQIADDLLAKIESGELARGRQLPTEIELMDQHSASRNTVRDAIKLLTARGLVEPRAGQGTFVVEKVDPFAITLSGKAGTGDSSELDVYASTVTSEGRQLRVTVPKVDIQRASRGLSDSLGVAEGDPVISRHQQLTIDKLPWALQTTFYPMEFLTKGAFRLIETENLKGGTLAYLKDAIDVNQVAWRDLISVRTPSETEAAFFRIPMDGRVSVFEIRRIGFGVAGPIRLTITVYPTDRNQFMYEEGPIPTKPS